MNIFGLYITTSKKQRDFFQYHQALIEQNDGIVYTSCQNSTKLWEIEKILKQPTKSRADGKKV